MPLSNSKDNKAVDPPKLKKIWTDIEIELLRQMVNEQIALEEANCNNLIPWSDLWKKVSQHLSERGHERSAGACGACWQRIIKEEIAVENWNTEVAQLLVRLTEDQLEAEKNYKSKVISWKSHWLKVSQQIKEAGYDKSPEHCRIYWKARLATPDQEIEYQSQSARQLEPSHDQTERVPTKIQPSDNVADIDEDHGDYGDLQAFQILPRWSQEEIRLMLDTLLSQLKSRTTKLTWLVLFDEVSIALKAEGYDRTLKTIENQWNVLKDTLKWKDEESKVLVSLAIHQIKLAKANKKAGLPVITWAELWRSVSADLQAVGHGRDAVECETYWNIRQIQRKKGDRQSIEMSYDSGVAQQSTHSEIQNNTKSARSNNTSHPFAQQQDAFNTPPLLSPTPPDVIDNELSYCVATSSTPIRTTHPEIYKSYAVIKDTNTGSPLSSQLDMGKVVRSQNTFGLIAKKSDYQSPYPHSAAKATAPDLEISHNPISQEQNGTGQDIAFGAQKRQREADASREVSNLPTRFNSDFVNLHPQYFAKKPRLKDTQIQIMPVESNHQGASLHKRTSVPSVSSPSAPGRTQPTVIEAAQKKQTDIRQETSSQPKTPQVLAVSPHLPTPQILQLLQTHKTTATVSREPVTINDQKSFFRRVVQQIEDKNQVLGLNKATRLQKMSAFQIQVDCLQEEVEEIWKNYDREYEEIQRQLKELEKERDLELGHMHEKAINARRLLQDENEEVNKLDEEISRNELVKKRRQQWLDELESEDPEGIS